MSKTKRATAPDAASPAAVPWWRLPIVWLLSIPFRILGALVSAILALLKAILMLPARAFGHRG